MSLLIMANEWAGRNNLQIRCVTVDHRLRKESSEEAEFVGNFCESLGIRHDILVWDGDKSAIRQGKLENLAREARYRLLSEFCEQNSIPILFTGHTWNDQLETFEMRKKFGSSACGLAGMSRVRSLTDRVKLLRPTLRFTKDYLESFLKHRNISWKTDPMNDMENFLRVAARKEILRRNDEENLKISNEITELGRMRSETEKQAVAFLKRSCELSDGQAVTGKNQLLAEEKAVQAEILRRIIWSIGGKKYATLITENICEQIMSQKINTIGRCLLKVKKDKIFVLRENRNGKIADENRPHSIENTVSRLPYEDKGRRISRSCFYGTNPFDIFL
jgi:tRNA(Ile)-lysidine synthase